MDLKNIKICVDAGHGINTKGKMTHPFLHDVDINKDGITDIKKGESYKEHSANVMVANFLTELLTKKGFQVFKTGWNDANAKDDLIDTSIEDRQAAIRKAKCDYVISVHFNASASTTGKFDNAEGVSVYVRTEKEKRGDSDKFASVILEELIKGTKQKNRGIGDGKFGMCNTVGMNCIAAIILELSFMTNEHEAQDLMANEGFCKECATEIYLGVLKYLGEDIEDGITFDKKDWNKRLQTSLNSYYSSDKTFKKLDVDGIVGKLSISALPIIKKGDKVSVVGLIQEKLNYFGYGCGENDSIFGEKTANAVKELQAKHGIVVNGIVSKKVWMLLV